jgi:tetratricopeptide (TPR) repeat protein
MSRIYALVLLFLFTFNSLFGQSNSVAIYFTSENILRFADYLHNQGEYLSAATEYERYLLVTPESNDSIRILIGKCYLRAERRDLAREYFRLLLSDSLHQNSLTEARLWLSYTYFMDGRYGSSIQLLNKLGSEVSGFQQERIDFLQCAVRAADRLAKEAIPIVFNDSSQTCRRITQLLEERERNGTKNPILAAGLSGVIPGLGKVYGGRPIDGLFSFSSIALTGWQAYDGFSKDGIKSVKGWLVGALGFTFYLGNVYGSALNISFQNEIQESKFKQDLHTLVRASFGL